MKKVFTILMVLLVVLGVSGCSTRSYKSEDYEVYEVISDLDELREEVNDSGEATMDYELKKELNGKYTIKLKFVFGDHNSEWKTRQFTLDEYDIIFGNDNPDEVWKFKVDGKEYDSATCMVLLEHYSNTMAVD